MAYPEEAIFDNLPDPEVEQWQTILGIGEVVAESTEAYVCDIATHDEDDELITVRAILQKEDPRVVCEKVYQFQPGSVVWYQEETEISEGELPSEVIIISRYCITT